jgi:ribosomal protein S12 methylthiotransferase
MEAGALTGMDFDGQPYAPVKLSEGCDRKCAFCAIPSFRGAFRSRDEGEILSEVKDLVSGGVREVCLVSQDTNAFGGDTARIHDIIAQMHEIPELAWIRLLYMYPDARTRRFMEQWDAASMPKLVPYLESPVQHASSRILKAMNRAGNRDQFAELFALAREQVPGLEVRTSILLGFPGEKSQDIDDVHRFLEECRPEKLALFAYSPEEGTTGYGLPGMPDEPDTTGAINEVRAHHLEILKEIHLARQGQVYECMIDEVHEEGLVLRRSQDAPEVDEAVHIDFEEDTSNASHPAESFSVGQIQSVRITGFFEYDMSGELVEKTS